MVNAATETKQVEKSTFSPLTCSTADDLFLPASRATLARLLSSWLNHHCLTITEFMHSASALEKFETAGMLYQHAMQRIALAQAAKSRTPVVQIIRSLNDLATQAINRVDSDEHRGLFPSLDAKSLAQMAQRLAGKPNARYILNGCVTKYLAAPRSWEEKLLLVLGLRANAPKEERSRQLFLGMTDAIAAEIVRNRVALVGMLGAELETGQRLMTAVRVFQGDTGADGLSAGLRLLGQHFAGDELADARFALADFILDECKGPNRFCPSSFSGELKAFRDLVDKLNAVKTRYLNQDELNDALVGRSKRFVTQQALSQIMSTAQTPVEKLECLMTIEESIEGEANKRALAPFMLSLLCAHDLKETFAAGSPGIVRIKRAADLQNRVLRSSYAEGQRSQMADLLDEVAAHIEAKGRLFEGLNARMLDPVERVDTYVRMFATGIFTRGKLERRAQQGLLGALAAPGFLAKYAADKDEDRKVIVANLIARLARAGLAPQDCLQALKL